MCGSPGVDDRLWRVGCILYGCAAAQLGRDSRSGYWGNPLVV